ncbi:MAG: aspartyl-phosphate phosphatase Spo0E family protein [Clostridiaceae bacterium]
MKNDLQKLKDKLNVLLIDVSLDSPEALSLSREIDKLIVEYYQRNNVN